LISGYSSFQDCTERIGKLIGQWLSLYESKDKCPSVKEIFTLTDGYPGLGLALLAAAEPAHSSWLSLLPY
jgi:hypothetical protein